MSRRFYITITFLLIFCALQAQRYPILFEYQPDNTFISQEGKNYVVKEVPDWSAAQIFTRVIKNFYENKTDVDTTSDLQLNSSVTFNLKRIFVGHFRKYDYHVDISITIQVKEGRLRVLSPHITNIYSDFFNEYNRKSLEDMIEILAARDVFEYGDRSYEEFNGSISKLIYILTNTEISLDKDEVDENDW